MELQPRGRSSRPQSSDSRPPRCATGNRAGRSPMRRRARPAGAVVADASGAVEDGGAKPTDGYCPGDPSQQLSSACVSGAQRMTYAHPAPRMERLDFIRAAPVPRSGRRAQTGQNRTMVDSVVESFDSRSSGLARRARQNLRRSLMDAWRTSCPKPPCKEDASDRGLVQQKLVEQSLLHPGHANGRELLGCGVGLRPALSLSASSLRNHRPSPPSLVKLFVQHAEDRLS